MTADQRQPWEGGTTDWLLRPQSLSAEGLAALKNEEGCRLHAYRDVAGVLTIGYGHTGPEAHEGLVWTQAKADAELLHDVAWAETAVSRAVKAALHQHEFDALVSFAFNIGAKAFTDSTLVKKLNQSPADFPGAAAEFLRWTKAGGFHAPVLLARRGRELLRFVGWAP